jgi:RNA polymerase sigma factor (TIGR02999 family)
MSTTCAPSKRGNEAELSPFGGERALPGANWAGDIIRSRLDPGRRLMAPSPEDITELLLAWTEGKQGALEQLTPRVYGELRRLAHHYMAGERTGHTLQSTALVNEAYLRLVESSRVRWQNRAHFFAISAQLMRRILVDFARSRGYAKRGGKAPRVSLDAAPIAVEECAEIAALDDALRALAAIDERKSKVVELRFFGGLSVQETAEVLGVSEETVARDWRMSKVWLRRELNRG